MKVLFVTTAVLLAVLASAKDHYVVKPEVHRMLSHRRPDVQQSDCKTCLVDKDNTKVCLTYGANLKVGWEWDQDWYDDPVTPNVADGFYNIEVEFYTKQGFQTDIWIFLDRIFEMDLDFEIDDFDVGFTIAYKYFRASKRSCFTVRR